MFDISSYEGTDTWREFQSVNIYSRSGVSKDLAKSWKFILKVKFLTFKMSS
jgi:hypothetical protein